MGKGNPFKAVTKVVGNIIEAPFNVASGVVKGDVNKVINGADSVTFGNEFNDLKCDDRTAHVFMTSIPKYVNVDGVKTSKNDLDYYRAYTVCNLNQKNEMLFYLHNFQFISFNCFFE